MRQLTLNDLAEKLKLQFHTYPREVKEVTGATPETCCPM